MSREPTLEDFHGENVAPRKIVVKREHLPLEVQEKINALRLQRKKRLGTSAGVGLIMGGALSAATAAIGELDNRPGTEKYYVVAAAINGPLLGLIRGFRTFAEQSAAVEEKVKAVGESIAKHGVVAEKHKEHYSTLPAVETLRETHPLFIVDRKGNVHLIPRDKLEAALAKARQKFWKHLLPFRKREEL